MVVRVTRLMEYEYPTVEAALAGVDAWMVPAQGAKSFGRISAQPGGVTIRSAVIGPVFGELAERIHSAIPDEEPVPVVKAVHEDLVRRARDLVTALDELQRREDLTGSVTLYRDRLRHWLQQYADSQESGDEEYGPDWLVRRVAAEWTVMSAGSRAATRRLSNDLYDALGAASTWVATHQ